MSLEWMQSTSLPLNLLTSFKISQKFKEHMVTDLNMWSYNVAIDALIDWTNCK